jgi:hypothetical protein
MQAGQPLIPETYTAHRVQSVRHEADAIVIAYDGRIFGGILPELLPPGALAGLVAGALIIVRLHEEGTGWPGQVAHMALWDADREMWIELYENG